MIYPITRGRLKVGDKVVRIGDDYTKESLTGNKTITLHWKSFLFINDEEVPSLTPLEE